MPHYCAPCCASRSTGLKKSSDLAQVCLVQPVVLEAVCPQLRGKHALLHMLFTGPASYPGLQVT